MNVSRMVWWGPPLGHNRLFQTCCRILTILAVFVSVKAINRNVWLTENGRVTVGDIANRISVFTMSAGCCLQMSIHIFENNGESYAMLTVRVYCLLCLLVISLLILALFDNVMHLCSWPHCNRRTTNSFAMMMMMMMMIYSFIRVQDNWKTRGRVWTKFLRLISYEPRANLFRFSTPHAQGGWPKGLVLQHQCYVWCRTIKCCAIT